jgi:hypothetical protein
MESMELFNERGESCKLLPLEGGGGVAYAKRGSC